MKKYIKLNIGKSILTIILTIMVAIGTILGTYGRSIVVDQFLLNNQSYIYYGISLVIIMILTEVFRCCLTINNANLVKTWIIQIGNNISENIASMGYENYHKINHGEYISWYTTDLERISSSYFEPFLNLFSNIVLSFVSALILFSIDWKIGVFSLVLLLILFIVGTRFGKKIGLAYQKFSQLSGVYTNKLQEYTSSYDVLKNFGALSLLKKYINIAQSNLEAQRVEAKRYTAFATFSFHGSQKIFEGIMFLFTLYLVSKNEISIGMLLSVPIILSLFLNSTAMLLEIVVQMQGMNSILQKVEERIIAETMEYRDLTSIEGKNITYSIEGKKVLDNLSFKFEKGKKYAILGPSGSGKSTLLNILLGRINQFEGQLLLNNIEKRKAFDALFSNEIAYVNQESVIFNLSVRDNILLGIQRSDEEIYDVLKKVKLYDLVMNLSEKLDTVISLAGNNLSGGEKQRIVLARALIRRTPIIILDEATSAIDVETAIEIEKYFVRDIESTVIMISHHLHPSIKEQLDYVVNLS
ncbi:ABC transporter ATP-binding protein [Aerococcaceae bacterium zg-BR9]|uniref:ATP-binding cassette domain-containing protein n=1 Tax=Aerococcaceae bacterium zg-1292 TaxID=2774330 RepID=UPI0040631AD3|nr:ABC transporter ATP-binding protein [Aerococcaceae bacterium zg-BR9]